MKTKSEYIFQSQRLGFRNWIDSDIEQMASINSDTDVMEFFPTTVNKEQTILFIERMKAHFSSHRYCYFAVEELDTQMFIGFIGLMEQTYEAPFTPCIDIGWRLSKKAWNKGYATEGAKRCLKFAFEDLKITTVMAIAPQINSRSILVMEKAGMTKKLDFLHPKLIDCERLQQCVCYEIKNAP